MRRVVVALLVVTACADERARSAPASKPGLPAAADLGPVSAFEPTLRRLCSAVSEDPCTGCYDRESGGRVSVYCDQQQPRRVTHLQVYGGSRGAPMRDGIELAIAYLEPVMTQVREQKLRHMAQHAGEHMVPPLTDPLAYWLDCYSVDGLVVGVSEWFRAGTPMISIRALSQESARCVETEWTVDRVPRRTWTRGAGRP